MSTLAGRSSRSQLLTTRQWEVLYGASMGETCIETGARLGLKSQTVKFHRKSVLQALNARTMHEAVAFAIQRSILP